MRTWSLFLMASVLLWLSSCQKETSIEGLGEAPLGDCIMEKMTPYDPVNNVGFGSLYTAFTDAREPIRTEIYDSVLNQSVYAANFTRSGDTLYVETSEYFVLDGAGRVEEYVFPEDPGDPASDNIQILFFYNTAGYLERRELYVEGIPLPLFVYRYTWTNGNMTNMELVFPSPLGDQVLLSAEVEYDPAITTNNFVYLFPDAVELAPYILALNLGRKSVNAFTRLTVNIYDDQGNVAQTQESTFTDYLLSTDGYVLSLIAQGDAQDALPLLDGETRFSYKCR